MRNSEQAEPLLWTLQQAGRAMAVSPRTVRRMQQAGELPTVHVGRARRVPTEAVREWVAAQTQDSHNDRCVGPGVLKGGSTCHDVKRAKAVTRTVSTGGRTHRTGGPRTSTRAAEELAAVLELPTAGRRKRS